MNSQQISQIQSLEELLQWMLTQSKWPIENPEIRRELIQAKRCFHRAIVKQLEE